jgi:hypothetical protein
MKKQYVAPQLTVHGNVAEMTQILGTSQRRDFVFVGGTPIGNPTNLAPGVVTSTNGNVGGTVISANNDIGSRSITLPARFPR